MRKVILLLSVLMLSSCTDDEICSCEELTFKKTQTEGIYFVTEKRVVEIQKESITWLDSDTFIKISCK